jgi:ABC-2 type transport system permease protein
MLEFLRFELRYQLRHSVLWLSCVAFLLLGFGSSVSPAFIFARMFGASHVNAPATVVLFMGIFTMLALVPTIAFAAEPVLRDFQTGMAEILYAMPVKKRQYILGRLAAGVVTTTVPFLCAILGSVLGATMPWLDPSVVGPVTVTPYIWGFLVIVLPNVLAIIAVDVSLATKTKSMGGVFVGVFAFFIFWIIAGVVALGANQQVATLIDPFGTRAFSLAVRDLKPGDINTLLPALTGQLLTNRVVWLVISSSLIVWSLISFDRVKIATSIRRRELARQADAKHRVSRAVTAVFDTLLKGVPAPLVRPTAQLLELSALKYGQAITSWAFMAVLALALTALAAGASQIGSATTVHPVTYWMLSDLKQVMGAAGIVIAVFAAGELAFRDREVRINELVDTMPVPHGIRVAANIGVLTLLTLTAFTGAVVLLIGLQIADGTVVVDLSTWLLGTTVVIVPIFCYGLIALALQMVVKTRIVGYVAFAALALLAYLGSLSSALDFVVSFVLPPNLRYSDLNGYGAPLLTFWIVTARLGAVTALAIALTWPRQAPTGIGAKHGGSGQRRARILSITVLTLVVVGLSGVLSPLAGYHTAGQDAQADLDRRADYEREHRSLLGAPQPVVSSVSTVVQIFPASRRATLSGSYTVENHTDQIISAIHFRLDPRAKYMLEVQGEPQIGAQDAMFVIANLRKPLQPGESRILSFHVDVVSPRLANDGYTDPVLRNGTLIPAFSVLPQFGYDSQGEIVDPETRARMHLGDRPMSASPNQSMLGPNVSWLSKFETTISTSDDQEAVAPGNLKKEWHELPICR